MLIAGLFAVCLPHSFWHTDATQVCRSKHICWVYFEIWVPVSHCFTQSERFFRRQFDVYCFDLDASLVNYELVGALTLFEGLGWVIERLQQDGNVYVRLAQANVHAVAFGFRSPLRRVKVDSWSTFEISCSLHML